ncbi:lysylphosphatidylglycerol synthase domain-containing protein [Aquipuribacter sp. MA13-6]|uniref:lysylphosphatidylglycerol synthase domain-containing protein n=1 Tax=unclassified Aquipuribacter TaxID=2635084 RepID=UPI003EEC5174
MSPRARLALRVTASVVALVVVALVVGEQAVRAGTAVLAPGPVALALLLGLLWRSLAATRWLLLSRALGAGLTWPSALAEYFRSELVNQVVPGGVVGDVDRARRHGSDVGLLPAARAVFLERTVGQLVLVAATAVTLLARPELLRVSDGVDGATVTVLALVLGVVALVAVGLWQPWRRDVGRSPRRDAAAGGRTGPRDVATPSLRALAVPLGFAVLLSLGVLVCFVALFLLAARVTGGEPAPWDVLVPAVLVVLLVSGIPLTVAGWGAREAGAALCFAAVGLASADGVAAAVGYGLLSLVSALPGLVPLLRPRRRAVQDPEGTQVEVEADVVPETERP